MFLKELTSITVAASFARLGTFIIVPFLVYRWDDEQLGHYDLYWSTLLFFEILFSMKLSDALFRYTLKSKSERTELLDAALFSLILLGIICTSLVLTLTYIFGDVNVALFLVSITASLRVIIFSIQEYERAVGNFFNHSLISIFLGVSYVLNVLILDAVDRLTINNLFFGVLAANILICTYAWRRVKPTLSAPKAHNVSKLFLFGATLLPSTLSWWVVRYASRWVIASTAGVVAVAFVTKTSYVALIYSALATIILQTFQRRIFNQIDSKSSNLSIEYERYLAVLATLSIIFCVGVICYSTYFELTDFYFSTVITVIIANWFLALSAFYGQLYTAHLKILRASISAVIGAIVTVTAMLLVVQSLGYHYYSLGILLGAFTMYLIRSIDLAPQISSHTKRYEYFATTIAILFTVVTWITPASYFTFQRLFILVPISIILFLMKSRSVTT